MIPLFVFNKIYFCLAFTGSKGTDADNHPFVEVLFLEHQW
jgi:hypothetical protein